MPWLRRLALLGVYGLVPASLLSSSALWHGLEAGKAWAIQGLIGLTFPAWMALAWRDPSARPPRTWVGAGVALNLLGIAASLPLAEDWHVGLWGSTERMGGLLTHLHLGAWFVMAAGLLRTRQEAGLLLKSFVACGALASLAGLLQLRDPELLGYLNPYPRSSSFQGNPVFFGAFMAGAGFAAALAWALETPGSRPTRSSAALLVVLFVGLLASGSRGALLAVAAGVLVSGVAWAAFAGSKRTLALGAAASLALGGLYLWVARVGLHLEALQDFWRRHYALQHLFEAFDDSDRLRTWRTAMAGIAERPVLGWGHGNYEAVYDAHYDPAEACVGFVQADAHNLVLEMLSTRGLVGFAAFAFLLAAAAMSAVRAVREGRLGRLEGALLLGLLAALHVPQGFNPDSPSSLVTTAVGWVLVTLLATATPRPAPAPVSTPGWLLPAAAAVGLATVVAFEGLPALASWHATRALQAQRAGRLLEAWTETKAAAKVPSPYLEEQLAVGLQQLVSLAESQALERLPAWRELLALDRELATRYLRHHKRLFFWRNWLKTADLVARATHDEALGREVAQGYALMVARNPRRQEVLQDWGEALARRGRLDDADAMYQRAIDVDPGVGSSHFRAGGFTWRQRNDADRGAALIARAAKARCPYPARSASDGVQFAQAWRRLGDRDALVKLVQDVEAGTLALTEQTAVAIAGELAKAGLPEPRDRLLTAAERLLPSRRGTFEALREQPAPADAGVP